MSQEHEMLEQEVAASVRSGNGHLFRRLLVVAVAMFGFGYAMVPLYKAICEVTGINILTPRDADAKDIARNSQVDASRLVTIEFDANQRGPWRFRPVKSSMQVHPGELYEATYWAKNESGRAIVGNAAPSFTPSLASRYFNKTECFCFTQQMLRAGEQKLMPVRFIVDPALPADVTTLTLSYRFYNNQAATAQLTAHSQALAARSAP
jgi:cytochrome c oxidase assembly protein subunit 11